ncbi:insecticidal delta-endotoxin Cry8Ea1 family protein [Listeria booriae]|uniref:insecticidal delta-endotoxin Cry8Ea1 family protein n=1 Tax=Listeria booriae TaxID=1552123 RepID=UPI001627BA4A|nr:insecticidal delta-endotoxin Cry8Ea1 family protein [Listeria booriae]MBC2190547.1 hypothetical protein [Listeria booriae]
MIDFLNSIPVSVLVALVGAVGTYLATKKKSKADVETIYTTEIRNIIDEYNRQLGELKEEITKLKKENAELTEIVQNLKVQEKGGE